MKTPLRSARFAIFTAVAFVLTTHSVLHAKDKPAPSAQQKKLTPEVKKQLEKALAPFSESMKLYEQGNYGEAEKQFRAAANIYERVLGAEHPDTLSIRKLLAAALRGQGKNAEAEQEHRAVLKVMERVLGAEHPDTLMSRNNLAGVLRAQGKNVEAEQEYRAVLEVRERELGAENPNTAQSCYNLALCLEDQNKLPEAVAFMQRAEQVWIKVLGADYPNSMHAKEGRERIEAKMKR